MKLTGLIYFICIIPLLTGCQTMGSGQGLDDPLRLYLDLDRSLYQPGDPLMAEVMILNTSAEPIDANVPNYESLTFWFRPQNAFEAFEIKPVYSSKERAVEIDTLAGDDLWRRTFVLPDATLTSGTFSLQAVYSSNPSGALDRTYTAATVERRFSVTGDTAFERDRDGVLLKKAAIRLARERFDMPEAPARARLIVNEAGFLEWFVGLSDSTGKEVKGALINPYVGTVRQVVDPAKFPDKEEKPVPRVFNRREQLSDP